MEKAKIQRMCQDDADQTTKCILNFNNMRSLLEPYNAYRSTLQGIVIRDLIEIPRVMNEIFITNFHFKFKFFHWNIEDIYTTFDSDTPSKINELQKKINEYIRSNLTENTFYMIYFIRPGHANLHFIDKTKKTPICYIYDPHLPQSSWLLTELANIYRGNGYTIGTLPKVILGQENLPLCYMYAVHFFLYMYITRGDQNAITKYVDACDDIFIMNFTKQILKLCHEYGLIDDMSYYLITDNTYRVQNLLESNTAININYGMYWITSGNMFNIVRNYTKLNVALFIFLLGSLDISLKLKMYELCADMLKYSSGIARNNLKAELYLIGKICDWYSHHMRFEYINKNQSEMINILNGYVSQINNVCTRLQKEGVELFIQHIINDKTIDGFTALMCAVNINNSLIVQSLIILPNLDINVRTKYNNTALTLSVLRGNIEIVQIILDQNPNLYINLSNLIGFSSIEIFRLILEKITNINEKDPSGNTPLMYAVLHDKTDAVRLILERNPDVNIQNNYNTALTLANPEIKRMLIEYEKKQMHGGNMEQSKIKEMCTPDEFTKGMRFTKCITNFNNMRSLLEPYNEYRAILQGSIIRDIIGIPKIMNQLFIESQGFKFIFLEWDVNDIYKTYSEVRDTKNRKLSELRNKMNNYITTNLTENIFYVIEFKLISHSNLHLIDNTNKICYIYDPHMVTANEYPEYWILDEFANIYRNNNYSIGTVPSVLLSQRSLALCFMYSIHFFLYMFITDGNREAINKYVSSCDDLFIMNFTKQLLKLCHEYGLIEYMPYYLLTDNTYKIQQLFDTPNSDIFNSGVLYLTSPGMFSIVKNNIQLNIADFTCLLLTEMKQIHLQIKMYDFFVNILRYINTITNNNLRAEIYIIGKILIIHMNELISKSPNEKSSLTGYKTQIERSCNELELYPNMSTYVSNIINDKTSTSPSYTALMYAIAKNNIAIIRFLFDKNSNINETDNNGFTPLMIAINSGIIAVIQLVLSKNPNINAQNNDGFTALMFAAGGPTNILQLILSNKPDVDILDNNEFSVLYHALGSIDNFRLLLPTILDINKKYGDGLTVLMIAVIKDRLDIVQLILNSNHRANIDFNIRDNNGDTVVMHADNKPEIKKILLESQGSEIKQIGGHNIYYHKYQKYKKKYLKRKF